MSTDVDLQILKEIPKQKIGRLELPGIQFGLWKTGGEPYFDMLRPEDMPKFIEMVKICSEFEIGIDNAPAYGKGGCDRLIGVAHEMLVYWLAEKGIEPDVVKVLEEIKSQPKKGRDELAEWLGEKTKPERPFVRLFNKCGLYWKGWAPTHLDMTGSPSLVLGKTDITPKDIYQLVMREYQQCVDRSGIQNQSGMALHWPFADKAWIMDGVLPALCELYNEGKIDSVGFSNVTELGLLQKLNERAKELGAAVHYLQNKTNILEGDLLNSPVADYCRENGIARVAYSALGHGAPVTAGRGGSHYVLDYDVLYGITRERQDDYSAFAREWHPRFLKIAEDIGVSTPVLALGTLMMDGIIPIFSSGSPAHFVENCTSCALLQTAYKKIGPAEEERQKSLIRDFVKEFAEANNEYHKSVEGKFSSPYPQNQG